MARGDQLIRQWRLLVALSARGGRSVEALARETGCSRRTVWRDLAILQQAGFPVTAEREGWAHRYRLLEGSRGVPAVPLTLPELAGLHVARDLLAPFRGSPLGDAIGSLLAKIDATLAPAAREFLAGLGRELSARTVHAKDPAGVRPLLATIQEAIRRRRTLEAEYHSFGRDAVSRRRLDPLHVWLQAGGSYLAAYCHFRREVRTFAVERFREVRETDQGFERPADFDLDRYLSGCFGLFRGTPVRVVLRFSREVARYVAERRWHPTQLAVPLLTGELELTLAVPLCPELRQWIMGYGRHVEVQRPARLRTEIRREWLAALRGPGGRVEPVRLGEGKPARPYRPASVRPALAAADRHPDQGTTRDRRLPARR